MNIRLPNKEKLTLVSNLATMLSAGIPILEAVESLEEESKGELQKILTQLKDDINQGNTVGDSFGRHTKTFDPVTINLLKSAEESGKLDETLKKVAVYIKKNIEFSGKVKSAMVYPTLVFALFIGILIVILTYVIPRIAEVFSKLKVTLPLATRVIIRASDIFLAYTIPIILGTLLLIILVALLFKFKKRLLANMLFSLPFFSKLANIMDMANFTNNLGVLLQSGIPITKAIEYSSHVVTRNKNREAIEKAGFIVSGGKTLSEGFEKSPDVFPKMMVRIVHAGERSGTLEQSLQELGDQFETQVDEVLKTLTTVLEPALLIVIGLFVGGIMLSIITPIYQLIGNIGPR